MKTAKKDRVYLGAPIGDTGLREAVMQRAAGSVETGVIREAVDGVSVTPGSEYIETSDDCDEDGWRECETLYRAPLSGPPQVATPAYRSGYDRVFGKQKVGLA